MMHSHNATADLAADEEYYYFKSLSRHLSKYFNICRNSLMSCDLLLDFVIDSILEKQKYIYA